MSDGFDDRGANRRLRGTRFVEVRWFDEIDSTNRYLLDAAADGASPGLVAVADVQTAGRGRRGRTWQTPAGSALMASALLRPSTSEGDRPALLGAAALAGAQALEALCGLDVRLKWPNDVMLEAKKVAGLLAEAAGADVVIGFGCNLAWASIPPELAESATAVDRHGVEPPEPVELLVRWLEQFDALIAQLEAGHLEAMVRSVAGRMDTIGTRVEVDLGDATLIGTARCLRGPGHLVVTEDDGTSHVVAAGDVVHLRSD